MKLNLKNCEVRQVSTMVDGGMKITLVTPELSIEDMASVLYAKKKGIAEEIDIDAVETEGKTPSERMRGVLFAYWKNKETGYKVFNDFYVSWIDKKCEEIKSTLPPL